MTIAEACFNPDAMLGAEMDGAGAGLADGVELFGEGASTVVLSVANDDVAAVKQLFAARGLQFESIGRVTDVPRLRFAPVLDEDVRELMRIYDDAIPRRLRGD